jgi:hypothetical protein
MATIISPNSAHYHYKKISPSAVGRLLRGGGRASAVARAAARLIRPAQHRVDHGRRATDAGLDGNGSERAIPAAGTALHARIAIPDFDMPAVHLKHRVRTYLHTRSASGALGFIEFQGNDIFEVGQSIHLHPPKQSRAKQSI